MTIFELLTEVVPTFEHLRATTAAVLPRLAAAGVVAIGGWFLAFLLRALVRRLTVAVGRSLPEGTLRAAWARAVEERGGGVFASGVYWLVIVATAMVASEALGLPVLTTWLAAIATYVPRVILAVAVVLGGFALGSVAGDGLEKMATQLTPAQARRLGRVTRVGIVGVGGLVAAGQLGLDVSFLSSAFLIILGVSLGSAALAFALGARGEIANILAMHYVQKRYTVGQWITVGPDSGRIVGTSSTAVFLEADDGQIAIPGAAFSIERCRLMSRTDDA